MGVRVEPSSLRAKSLEISDDWPDPPLGMVSVTPCGYQMSTDAVNQLNSDATHLSKCLLAGHAEARRLGQAFWNAADVYEAVDQRTRDAVALGRSASTEPLTPRPVRIERSPKDEPKPRLPITADALPLDESAAKIEAPDQGHSLDDFSQRWKTYATALKTRADYFHIANVDWEGDAANAAYDKLRQHQAWMEGVVNSCKQLSANAETIYHAHFDAAVAHPKKSEVEELKNKIIEAMAAGNGDTADQYIQQWDALRQEADHIRNIYAQRLGGVGRIAPDWPPDAVPGAAAVTSNGEPPNPAATSAGSPLPGGGAPGGPTAPAAPTLGARRGSDAGMPAKPTGEHGGAPSSGGSPGGSPSSGGSGGKLPSLPSSPHLPKGPSVKPASVGAHGGSGGGHGGGAGAVGPLQPAVTGSAVAPPHGAAAHGAQAGHAGPTAPVGAAAGGGGAPMGCQGGHGQGGKEKRRTPGLSPEEELYKEDREWTEGVIGHRKRRDVRDGTDSGGST